MQSPSDYYDICVQRGDLQSDTAQRGALVPLDGLHRALLHYTPCKNGLMSRLFGKNIQTQPPPHGVFIHGTVGNGKTVLLQCFYETVPTDKKVYFHLHHFLSDVNTRLKRFADSKKSETDSMRTVIDSYMKQAWVFCFDECVVGDVADAMLFGQIAMGIMERGGVMVCTSNFSPDTFRPRGGVGANAFKQYAQRFFNAMEVFDMNSPTDYRVIEGDNTWRFFWDAPAIEAIDALVAHHTTAPLKPENLSVRDRTLHIPLAGDGVCKVSYTYILEGAFGAEDFMTLARKYHTVILTDMMPISADNTSIIKRFIVLVDCLYEHKSRLVISATCTPENIYPDGLVAFEFSRALSRLNAMQAVGYSRAETGKKS